MNRLLIDVGASSIKSVIQKNNFLDIETRYVTESFSTKYGDKFNPEIIIKEFINHVLKQYDSFSFKEIWICSEMHNFTLFDIKTKKYSDFYSWRYISKKSDSIKSKLLKFNNNHHEISGQTLLQGIPIINLSEALKKNSSQRFLTLPELIVHKYGECNNKVHDTMAASSGLLNIKNKNWLIDDLSNIYPNVSFILPDIFDDNEIPLIGKIKIKDNSINVFGGFGDLQTALFGTGILKDEICINIGTGSQIIAINNQKSDYSNKFDIKPFFGKYIKAITHIPAGRSFNFINNEICNDKNFWSSLNKTKKTLNDDYIPEFNLNIFKSNWRYDIHNKNNILNSYKNNSRFYEVLLKTFCEEYLIAIKKLDPSRKNRNLVLSGGKLKDIFYVKSFFENLGSYSVKIKNDDLLLDETLIGLNMLTKIYN